MLHHHQHDVLSLLNIVPECVYIAGALHSTFIPLLLENISLLLIRFYWNAAMMMKIFRLSSPHIHSNWKTFNFRFSIPQEFFRVFSLFVVSLSAWFMQKKINICWKIPLWFLIGSKSALDWRDLDHENVEIFCVRFTSLLFMCSWNAAKKFHFFCSGGSTISPQSDVERKMEIFREETEEKIY